MSVTEVQLYKRLKGRLGEPEAQDLIDFVKSEINTEFMLCKQVFLTKDDKIELMQIMKNDKEELMHRMKSDKAELTKLITDVKTELHTFKVEFLPMIKEQRVDMLRSIYFVTLTQYLAVVATVLAILKFAIK